METKYGKLTIIRKVGKRCECQCDCGNKKWVDYNNLRSGNTRSCGCGQQVGLTKRKKYEGSIIGIYQVLEYLGNRKYKCKCTKCGEEKIVHAQCLTYNAMTRCKCTLYIKKSSKQAISHIGERYGRLEVVARDTQYEIDHNIYGAVWKCKCDCGNFAYVKTSNLKRTHSCGCLQKEHLARLHISNRKVLTN